MFLLFRTACSEVLEQLVLPHLIEDITRDAEGARIEESEFLSVFHAHSEVGLDASERDPVAFKWQVGTFTERKRQGALISIGVTSDAVRFTGLREREESEFPARRGIFGKPCDPSSDVLAGDDPSCGFRYFDRFNGHIEPFRSLSSALNTGLCFLVQQNPDRKAGVFVCLCSLISGLARIGKFKDGRRVVLDPGLVAKRAFVV